MLEIDFVFNEIRSEMSHLDEDNDMFEWLMNEKWFAL